MIPTVSAANLAALFARRIAAPLSLAGVLMAVSLPHANAVIIYETGFEPPEYVLGNIDGQAGWSTPIGPVDRVRVRNDIPRVGAQSLWAASGGGGVAGTGAYRNLAADLTGGGLRLSSRITFTTGVRSDWEVNSVFGAAGFLGGLRVAANDEFVLETALASFATGVFIGGFQTVEIAFDFTSGLASAFRDGTQIASGVAFDNTNTTLTQVAALRLITPGADAIALDSFAVDIPEPGTATLFGLGMVALGWFRRRKIA